MQRALLLGVFVISLLLISCAHVISEQYRKSAVTGVSFSQIRQDPDKYLNESFILGGTIVEATNTAEGSELEVVDNPIDRFGEVTDKDISEGRFIVVTPVHLDPLIYRKDREITMAGKLIGTRTKVLYGGEYAYPLFEAEQLHLWKEARYYYAPYPYYYDPFFSPYYGFGPFWGRPYFYP